MHTFTREQKVTKPISEIWDFFSNPVNLEKITPPHLKFNIHTKLPEKVYPGLIINYTISLGVIPMNWTTEITQVEDQKYFIDEQRFGPYAFWHHQHHFEELDDGTLIKDWVHYKLPFGILGKAVHALTVRSQLKDIFDYRHQVIDERFN